jgi:cysteinyl-tRNA synthetase
MAGVISVSSAALASEHYDDAQRLKRYLANGLEQELNDLVSTLKVKGVLAEVSADGYVTLERIHENAGTDEMVRSLIAARLEARKRKDFAEADRIRKVLDDMGIALKDGKDPATGEPITTWDVKR